MLTKTNRGHSGDEWEEWNETRKSQSAEGQGQLLLQKGLIQESGFGQRAEKQLKFFLRQSPIWWGGKVWHTRFTSLGKREGCMMLCKLKSPPNRFRLEAISPNGDGRDTRSRARRPTSDRPKNFPCIAGIKKKKKKKAGSENTMAWLDWAGHASTPVTVTCSLERPGILVPINAYVSFRFETRRCYRFWGGGERSWVSVQGDKKRPKVPWIGPRQIM